MLVSATMPQDIQKIVGEFIDIDSLEFVSTESLHHVLPHIKQKFIRLHKYDRDARLLHILKTDIDKNRPVLIFSARTPMSNYLGHFLRDNGIECLKLNKSLRDFERLENFERFQSGDVNVLTCTDLASRGLDTVRVRMTRTIMLAL